MEKKTQEKETQNVQKRRAKTTDHPQLEKLLTDSLKDIYWAEKHLVKALTKLEKESTTDELKQAFQEHKTVTEGHVSRVEKAFEMLGVKPVAQKCEAIEGITKEAESMADETEQNTFTRDAALIMAAQKAEHYEIASYGGIIQLARTLQKGDIADLLAQTLEEEKDADKTLTKIAEASINEYALDE